MSAAVRRAVLTARDAEPGGAVRGITVDVRLTSGWVLACHYVLEGDLTRLRVPLPHAGQRADGLWQHTCFEVFIAVPGASGYYEFNFSPSHDWAAYHFGGYRADMSVAGLQDAPELGVHSRVGRLQLRASVPLAGLGRLQGGSLLRLALAAVTEAADGRLTYWALQHAPGKPDFHHPDGFVMELHAP